MYKLFTILLASLVGLCMSHVPTVPNVTLAVLQPQLPQQGVHIRNIQIIKDIKDFIRQNPHLSLIRLDKKAPVNHRSQSVKYTLGNRVPGDRFLAQYADTFFYPALKDVSTQVTYPDAGTGSVVTSVDISCLQNNSNGNAYVVAGGVGQRYISIVLEATQTDRFTYSMHVYGTD